jgi:hypothetical protein
MGRRKASSVRKARLTAIVVLVALVAAVQSRADEILDRVLAVVGGDLILLSDVSAARELRLVQMPAGADPIGAVLAQLIDRELVLAEVERYAPPEPPASAVEREVDVVRRRFASADAFRAALARTGIDEGHLRETIRENLRISAYLDQRFTVLSPTEEEVARFYRDSPARFTVNGRLQPYESVRGDAASAWVAARRKQLVDEWIAGLRRRADIIDLYVTSSPAPAQSKQPPAAGPPRP